MILLSINKKVSLSCWNKNLEKIEESDFSEEDTFGADIGSKRTDMEDEEIDQFSEEEVVVEVQDPYQQWYNKREFTEEDKKKADEIL